MRKRLRKAGVAAATAFASAALVLSSAPPALTSPSGLVVGGLQTSSMHDLVMAQLLKDELHGMKRVSIHWPAQAAPYSGKDYTLGQSISIGVTNLNAAIDTAVGKLVRDANGNLLPKEQVKIVGLSAGSLVVTEMLRQLARDPDAPQADELTFIVVADSSRQKLIDKTRYNSRLEYSYQIAPDSQYDVKVVTGEYDGMADFPDRWWNLLAVVNAIAGGIVVHMPVMFADLKDEYITGVETNELGGTVTNYLIPTAKLPLVQLLPFLAPREAELKAKIDKGYSRNDVVSTSAARSVAKVSSVDIEPTVTGTSVDEAEEATGPSRRAEVTSLDTADAPAPKNDDAATNDEAGEVVDVAEEDAEVEASEDAEVADLVKAVKDEDDARGAEARGTREASGDRVARGDRGTRAAGVSASDGSDSSTDSSSDSSTDSSSDDSRSSDSGSSE